jgi:hypothetical protein
VISDATNDGGGGSNEGTKGDRTLRMTVKNVSSSTILLSTFDEIFVDTTSSLLI